MKTYLCVEGDEEFLIEANSFAEAQIDAMVYGANVIREVKPEELGE